MSMFLVAANALAPLLGNAYEDFQASKLGNGSAIIARLDKILERQLCSRFQRLAKTGIIRSPALGVGARLGAEVRALNTVVSLGIGIDFNPGPKSRWVLYGDARALPCTSTTPLSALCTQTSWTTSPSPRVSSTRPTACSRAMAH